VDDMNPFFIWKKIVWKCCFLLFAMNSFICATKINK
jgi:hypothetical protein